MEFTQETIRQLSTTHTDAQIAALFGFKTRKVNWWRNKWQLPSHHKHKGNRLYALTQDFFAVLQTQEQAFILGFIAADGCLHRNGRTLAITLHPRDRHILEDIRVCLGSTAPLHTTSSLMEDGRMKERLTLQVSSQRLVADVQRWGITPKKSLTLGYPSLPPHLESHYIRGVWDGDGHIGPRQFCLVGALAHLEGIQAVIKREVGLMLSLSKMGNIYRLQGSRSHRLVLHWLYAHSIIHLHRKYAHFLTYWQ